MSKFRNRFMKRVMAVVLSGAMLMSNMTAYADEIAFGATDELAETASETIEPEIEEAEEAVLENAENVGDENGEEKIVSDPILQDNSTEGNSTEGDTTAPTETETEQKTAVPTAPTETEIDTETSDTSGSTEETSETEISSDSGSENPDDDEETGVYDLDLSEGLTASKEYGNSVLKLSVLCEMPLKSAPKEIDGVSYSGYVAGGQNKDIDDNPKNKSDKHPEEKNVDCIPVKGAVFKMKPLKDAKITFVIDGSTNKVFQLVRDDGASGEMIDKSTNYKETGFDTGAYTFKLKAGETYYFFGVASKIGAYAISWKDKNANRPAWGTVAKPAITAAIDENDKEKIRVTVDAAIGNDADKLTVYMYNEDGTQVIETKESEKEQDRTIFEFVPEVSGRYKFKAQISRDNERDPIESEFTKVIDYTITETQEWKYTTYGNGTSAKKDTVTVHDDGTVTIAAASGKIVPNSNDGLTFYYTTVNPNTTNFTFSANAHVDKWKYSNGQEGFGVMVADTVGDLSSDDPVKSSARFWNNSYQAVVSKIAYKWNGVEVSEDNSGDAITMQIGVGATEKIGVTPEDVQAIIIDNEAQQPARYKAEQFAIDTTYAKYGTGQYNMVKNWENEDAPIGSNKELYEDFWLQVEKNNTGYAVSYAKYEVDASGAYKLDEDGKKIVDQSTMSTKQYYDPDVLSVLDSNKVYVGVFAARNATITFSDMNLETRLMAEDDTDRVPKPVKYVNLSNSILSGGVTNTETYTLMFASNWKGKFRLKDSSGKFFTYTDEDGNEKDTWEVNGTLDPEIQYCQDGDDAKDTKVRVEIPNLSVGKNDFTIEYTPDAAWSPEYDKYDPERKVIELKNYNMVEIPFSVEYRKYGEEGQTIYVSQDGKSTNIGTKESPLDIYTAVKYVQPGQTILLNGGRYSLNTTLQITKGVNGKPDVDENGKETYNNYIKMIGDPSDKERPVLDFNGTVAAVVAVGDYWYFKDFDVIRCKDGEKGIQVSGSWCVFDRVDTYRNGSTGLQICRAANTDTYRDWPHDNLILNCNSYLNVDKGYEDADGFAAKLTSGSNNVFDGCIAAFNADDGWDLFAKAQTGSIGGVIIRNSIAYRNGYVLKSVKDGTIKTPAEAAKDGDRVVCVKGDGNGNGFKMGGDGLPAGSQYDEGYEERKNDPNIAIPNIGHRLENSLTFGNKSKGIDSNSAPNIKAYNCISYNNDGANISLYTYDTNKNTDYELQNVVSMRTGTDPSRIEPDAKTFPADANGVSYKPTHSINFMSEADPGNKSSALYFSLKNARSMKATVKVWWRSSNPDTDCEMMIMSEKGEVFAREYSNDAENRRLSNDNGLIVSELVTKNKEKCYLGSKDGSVNFYKAEITVEVQENGNWETKTYTVDISAIDEYKKCTAVTNLERNGSKSKIHSKPVEITLYYRAIPSDGVDSVGAQNIDKINNDTVYKWDVSKNTTVNKSGNQIKADEFESFDYPYLNTVSPEKWRNSDGTIKTDGFLELKPGAGSYPADQMPSLGGTESPVKTEDLIGEDTDGSVSSGNAGTTTPGTPSEGGFGEDYPEGGLNVTEADGKTPKYFRRIWAADIKYINYTDKEDIVYTGKAIQPEVHVYFSGNDTALRKGKDYQLKYENNINAGEAKVIITGKGNYAGYNNEKTFTIKAIDLETDETIFIPSCVAPAAGKDAKKEIKPTWMGKALKEGKDYTIEEHPDNANLLVVKGKAPNFEGERNVTKIDNAPADKLMSKASVKITTESAKLVYDQNNGVEPECEVKLGGTTLEKGTDYTVKYANNKEIGKATLTVVGINDGTTGYFGSKSVNFTIKKGNLKDAEISYTVSKESKPLADYVATLNGVEFNGSSNALLPNRINVVMNGRELINGTDFKIVQSGTERAGTATVTIKGMNGYVGAQAFKFKILPLNIDGKNEDGTYKIPDSAFSFPEVNEYKIGGVKFDNFILRINGAGVDAKNYTLSYKNNNIVASKDDLKPPTLVVTGRNGLKGKREFTFTVKPSPMSEEKGISVSAKDIVTNGKEIKYSDLKRARITVTQTVGLKSKRLAAGRDYDKNIKYYIDMDGDYKITENVDHEVDITSKNPIAEFDTTKGYMTVLIRITAAKDNPKCYYGEGFVDSYFRVGTTDISRAKVIYITGQNRVFGQEINESDGKMSAYSWDTVVADIDKYVALTYDSKYNPNKKPKLKPSDPDESMTLEERKESGKEVMWIRKTETEYLIRPNVLETDGYVMVPNSYKKNDRVGTASFEIRGTGKYAGTKRVTFKILSKQAADKMAER